jgi:uncharacterized protein YcbK (DUF882 family)
MITRSFSKKELACPCCGECKMDQEFLTRLQTYRDLLGVPLILESAYRCRKHNREVGGKAGSMHLQGKAADPRIIPGLRYRMIELAQKLEFSGIGLGKTKMHIDTSPVKQRSWSY